MKQAEAQPKKKRVLRIVKWVFVALAIASSAGIMIPLTAAESGKNFTLQLVMFIAYLVVCLTAWVLIIVDLAVGKKRKLKIFANIGLFFALPVVCGGVLLGMLYVQAMSIQADNDAAKAARFHQDPELLVALKDLGAKGNYGDLILEQSADMARLCGWQDAGGCYTENEFGEPVIYMKAGLRHENPNFFQVAAAHEYLHYVWHKNKLDDDRQLTSALIDLYGKNQALQQRVGESSQNHYLESGGLQPTEFFSYGCTEATQSELGDYIWGRCNEYIDASTLPQL